MRRTTRTPSLVLLAAGAAALVLSSAPTRAGEKSLEGEWRTSLGVVTFKAEGDSLVATFENPRTPPVKGPLRDNTATLTSREGNRRGDATIKLDDSGRSFSGTYQYGEGQRTFPPTNWNGWRPDPEAPKAATGKFAGLWLTTQGLMEIIQDGDKITGRYARYGPVRIEGTITGRRLDFTYTWLRNGKGWLDLSKDDKSIDGAALDDGSNSWYEKKGRRADEFRRDVPLAAGKIVDGSTENLLTYSVRAPEGYKEGDKTKKWPAIVILHGSNMNGRAYVSSIAQAWPDIARDHIVIGINGEVPSDRGDDPRFNFTYVNHVGRSTYRGFPGTDRESPALVSEALDELKRAYPIKHFLVGGHSQGGFLTYSILMNSPEKIAGAFPISCGLIFQCEPTAYDNEPLRRAQRAVPLAIVHGKSDPVVDFGMSQYAAGAFGESSWPALRFFTSDDAGHRFMLLPVGEAIRWLEAQASDDPSVLVSFAEKEAKAGHYRDAIAALRRAATLRPSGDVKQRVDKLNATINARARPKAEALARKIKTSQDGRWIDDFLAFRDEFEFADAARRVMDAFDALRKKQDSEAQKTFNEAITAFRQGKQADGYARYQEIVDKYYASSWYRKVKEQLKSRPK